MKKVEAFPKGNVLEVVKEIENFSLKKVEAFQKSSILELLKGIENSSLKKDQLVKSGLEVNTWRGKIKKPKSHSPESLGFKDDFKNLKNEFKVSPGSIYGTLSSFITGHPTLSVLILAIVGTLFVFRIHKNFPKAPNESVDPFFDSF